MLFHSSSSHGWEAALNARKSSLCGVVLFQEQNELCDNTHHVLRQQVIDLRENISNIHTRCARTHTHAHSRTR